MAGSRIESAACCTSHLIAIDPIHSPRVGLMCQNSYKSSSDLLSFGVMASKKRSNSDMFSIGYMHAPKQTRRAAVTAQHFLMFQKQQKDQQSPAERRFDVPEQKEGKLACFFVCGLCCGMTGGAHLI